MERGGLEAAATIYNGCCRSGALQGSTVPMVGMGSAGNGLPRSLRSLAMTRGGGRGRDVEPERLRYGMRAVVS